MAAAVHDLGNSATFSGYAEARAGRCQRMTKIYRVHNLYQDDEDKEVATQEFDMIQSTFFNSHSIRSVIIAKSEFTESFIHIQKEMS